MHVHQCYWATAFFCCCAIHWFATKIILISYGEFEEFFPFLFFFSRRFKNIDITSLLFDGMFQWSHLVLDFSLEGDITDTFFFIVIDFFKYSFFRLYSWLAVCLGVWLFQIIKFLSITFIVIMISLMSLWIFVMSALMSSFLSLTLLEISPF